MELDELIQRILERDQAAWRTFLTQITPQIEAIARSHAGLRSRGLAARPDDLAEVTTATFTRLARDEHKNLRRYLAQRAHAKPQSFDSWLYGAVDYTIRDHLRSRYGRAPKVITEQPQPSKRDFHTQAELLADEPLAHSLHRSLGLTTKLSMAKILAYIEAHFSDQERLALQLHYAEDKSFDDLAAQLELPDVRAAEKLIRRLNARLRHHFAEAGD